MASASAAWAWYAYETVEARRFQAEQTAAFERGRAHRGPRRTLVKQGDLVGMLDVPRLQLSTPVIEGDDTGTLRRAVGHLPDTPMPWNAGNSAIAGHRDGLFRPLKDVKIGDEIRFRTTREEYPLSGHQDDTIVKPDDLSVLAPQSDPATLTLITCYPFYLRRFRARALRCSRRPRTGRDLPVIDRIISGSA